MINPVATLMREALGKGIEALAEFNRRRLPAPAEPHPFLNGIHAPMTRELTLTQLAVTGEIPPRLAGRYLRIGPNPVDADPASYHWFIGDGMVHAIALGDGMAHWYRNRWIRSEAVAKARGVAPAPGPRHVFDTVNTNVLAIGGQTFALVEAGSYPVILGETLETQRYDNFAGSLAGSFTAHPHFDPLTGEHHAICYEGKDPDVIRHVVIDAAGTVIREQPIAVSHGPMIHDSAFTARFIVILDLPITLSLRTLIAGQAFPYKWNPRHPARIGLLPRHGTQDDVIWCDIDPAAAFHIANAYEDARGHVVLDLIVYETMFADGIEPQSRGLERWTIDPIQRTVRQATLDAAPQDFPRIDERRAGQRHRFVWTTAIPDGEGDRLGPPSHLYAHDLTMGTRQVHDFGPGRHPGEFVFIPEDVESREGEGWLMGLVIDERADATDLVILDARRFTAPPVASVRLPHRVPPGFHGNWVPDAAMAQPI